MLGNLRLVLLCAGEEVAWIVARGEAFPDTDELVEDLSEHAAMPCNEQEKISCTRALSKCAVRTLKDLSEHAAFESHAILDS